jgi:hypothetical protein
MDGSRRHGVVQNGCDRLTRIDQLAGQGAGIGFIHFAVEVLADQSGKDFLL